MRTNEAIVAVLLGTVVLVAGVLPWVRVQYRRYGRLRGWSAILATGIVLYGCGVVAFTLFPLPTITPEFCAVRAAHGMYQFRPFASLDDITAAASTWPARLRSGAFLQVALNVLLYVPLGFLLRYRWGRSLPVALAVGLAVSLAIETIQGTAVFGVYPCPYRLADVDDLLTNTTGTLVGWLVAVPLSRVLPAPVPAPVPDLDPPTLRRRGLAVLADMLAIALTATTVHVVVLLVGQRTGSEWVRSPAVDVAITVLVAAVVVLVVPLARADRATVGQATVALALVDAATGVPARRGRVLLRAGVWWLPAVVLLLAGAGFLPVLVAAVLAAVASRRPDRRSVLGLAAGTRTVTAAALADAAGSSVGFTRTG